LCNKSKKTNLQVIFRKALGVKGNCQGQNKIDGEKTQTVPNAFDLDEEYSAQERQILEACILP